MIFSSHSIERVSPSTFLPTTWTQHCPSPTLLSRCLPYLLTIPMLRLSKEPLFQVLSFLFVLISSHGISSSSNLPLRCDQRPLLRHGLLRLPILCTLSETGLCRYTHLYVQCARRRWLHWCVSSRYSRIVVSSLIHWSSMVIMMSPSSSMITLFWASQKGLY